MKNVVILSNREWNKIQKELDVLKELRSQDSTTQAELKQQKKYLEDDKRLLEEEKISLDMQREGIKEVLKRNKDRENELGRMKSYNHWVIYDLEYLIERLPWFTKYFYKKNYNSLLKRCKEKTKI